MFWSKGAQKFEDWGVGCFDKLESHQEVRVVLTRWKYHHRGTTIKEMTILMIKWKYQQSGCFDELKLSMKWRADLKLFQQKKWVNQSRHTLSIGCSLLLCFTLTLWGFIPLALVKDLSEGPTVLYDNGINW